MKEADLNLIPIEAVPDDDLKLTEADIGVCMEATPENIENVPPMWKDQIGYGECAHCGRKIFFRTNFPEGLTKVCVECAFEAMDGEANPVMVTRQSGVDELRDYLKKKEQN